MSDAIPRKSPDGESPTLMLRVDEAAQLAGLGRTKFLELLYAGEIPGVVRFGRAVRINRLELEAWLHDLSSRSPHPARTESASASKKHRPVSPADRRR